MNCRFRQISAMEKVRSTDKTEYSEITRKTVMQGERICYQIVIDYDAKTLVKVEADSPFCENLKLYKIKEAVMDTPVTADVEGEDYITTEPGLMPEILIPMEENNFSLMCLKYNQSVLVRIDVPADFPAGVYKVNINFNHFPITSVEPEFTHACTKTMEIEVTPHKVPEQKLIYTRWFYADCIADAHNTKIYSEEHWALIEKYMMAARDSGINMILVPVHTPPLDTAIGTQRPCVQLVDIEKHGDTYSFDFSKFHRFISLAKKCKMEYFEIAHMFSQWGAKSAPNIMVTENGKTDYMFGWHVASDSEMYISFLKQYIGAISKELEAEGISDKTYFHISDEPSEKNLEKYAVAKNIIKPLIGNSKTFDALSHFEFYEKGLVECPVTAVEALDKFLGHNIENQWVYYCCVPLVGYLNSVMAMPLYRIRVIGFLMYKYNIRGFLHWGFNYYNSWTSLYNINPYITTSADGCFPSGDGAIVYPGKNTVYSTVRGEAMFAAVQDMDICCALEEKIGREAVIKMIDDAAGMDITFNNYPKSGNFLDNLREAMVRKINEE